MTGLQRREMMLLGRKPQAREMLPSLHAFQPIKEGLGWISLEIEGVEMMRFLTVGREGSQLF